MTPVLAGKTVDRAVLGILVDFAKSIPYYLDPVRRDNLPYVEQMLQETPCCRAS